MRKSLSERPAAIASCLDLERRKKDGVHEDFSGTRPICSVGYKLPTCCHYSTAAHNNVQPFGRNPCANREPAPSGNGNACPNPHPDPTPNLNPDDRVGNETWQPALPEEPCVASETKACRVLFVGSLAGKPEIWFNTKWTTLYDLEDLSLVLSLPGVDPSIYYRFSLAEFVARIESTR